MANANVDKNIINNDKFDFCFKKIGNDASIMKKGKNTNISVKGRHDPCVGIRAVPIGEAMISCVLLDHFLLNRAQCG